MKRAAYTLANLLGAVVEALLILDPTRGLAPVFVLLALAGGLLLARGGRKKVRRPK